MLEKTGLFSVITDVPTVVAVEFGLPAEGDLEFEPGLAFTGPVAEGILCTVEYPAIVVMDCAPCLIYPG